MKTKQTVYFMTLVGGLAGFLCWSVQVWLSDSATFSQENQWMLVTIYTSLMGGLIGGLTVGFADHWSIKTTMFRWIAMGALLGLAAGVVSGLLYIPVLNNVILQSPSAAVGLLGRVLSWLIAGGLIGFVTGLRWFDVNRLRAFHALTGGMVGGALGALVFTLAGAHEFFQALAFILTGAGITLGVTLAPVLLKDGVVEFISSGDARAQHKYGAPRQEWLMQDGDRHVIGSQSAESTMTMFARGVQIYIPDSAIAPRHAVVIARNKHFYLQPHPDNIGPGGQALAPLMVAGYPVVGTQELQDGTDLLVGRTILRFRTKTKRAENDQQPLPPRKGGVR